MSEPVLLTRNRIFKALLALADNAAWNGQGFKSRARKYRDPMDFDPSELPALIQIEPTEQPAATSGMPYKRTFHCVWLIYFATDVSDATDIGAELMSDILDAIQGVIAPPGPDDMQTLGGLVHNVTISDMIYKVAGDDTGAGMIVVPLQIIAP